MDLIEAGLIEEIEGIAPMDLVVEMDEISQGLTGQFHTALGAKVYEPRFFSLIETNVGDLGKLFILHGDDPRRCRGRFSGPFAGRRPVSALPLNDRSDGVDSGGWLSPHGEELSA